MCPLAPGRWSGIRTPFRFTKKNIIPENVPALLAPARTDRTPDMSKNSEAVMRWRRRHPEAAKAADAYQNRRHLPEHRDAARRLQARLGGYLPPPLERDCPPRTDHCQYCHKPMDRAAVRMDHNHNTGAFCAWVCNACNARVTDRIGDFGEGAEVSTHPEAIRSRKRRARR